MLCYADGRRRDRLHSVNKNFASRRPVTYASFECIYRASLLIWRARSGILASETVISVSISMSIWVKRTETTNGEAPKSINNYSSI